MNTARSFIFELWKFIQTRNIFRTFSRRNTNEIDRKMKLVADFFLISFYVLNHLH